MNKKVLILCPFSYPSACGIWTRVYNDAITLRDNGYDVSIFSSNIIKGTKDKSSDYEEYEGLKIYRFNVFLKLGGTSMFWNFLGKIHKVNPEIIHTHGYRHPHSLLSLIWGKLNSKTIFLTTHAPFEKDTQRPVLLKIIDTLYDIFIGWWELKIYSRVIRISKWENKYLLNLGLKNSILISNGIKDIFLKNKPNIIDAKPKNSIIYMGRIDPVKRPEWIIQAASKLQQYNFKIVGPLSGYQDFSSELSNVEIIQKKYNEEEFIAELANSDIYVLPSIREAMPFTLLEAMSRGVYIISSNSNGGSEVVVNESNGFIVENIDGLINKIKDIYKNWEDLQFMRYNALATANKYSAKESGRKLLVLYSDFDLNY